MQGFSSAALTVAPSAYAQRQAKDTAAIEYVRLRVADPRAYYDVGSAVGVKPDDFSVIFRREGPRL